MMSPSGPLRLQHVRGGGRLHPVSVRGPEQEEGHQGDLHPLHLRHGHQERAVRVRRRHRRHHQEQPEGLRPLLRRGKELPLVVIAAANHHHHPSSSTECVFTVTGAWGGFAF